MNFLFGITLKQNKQENLGTVLQRIRTGKNCLLNLDSVKFRTLSSSRIFNNSSQKKF